MKGIILKGIGGFYYVRTEDGVIECKARGKFRNLGITPLVGDNALIDEENNYILEIQKRKNELFRPSISNVDQAIIVMSNKIPEFSLELLDKLLCIIEYNNIKPIIYVSKIDLLSKSEFNNLNLILEYLISFSFHLLPAAIR